MADDGINVPIKITGEGVEIARDATAVVEGLTAALKDLSAETKRSAADRVAAERQARDELAASAKNLANLRKADRDTEAAARKKDADERRASERQFSDEQKASARQLSVLRKKDADDRRTIEKQAADDIRAARRTLLEEQKAALATERAARKADRAAQKAEAVQARDEQNSSTRQILADRAKSRQLDAAARKADFDRQRAERRQLNDELKASERQLFADRQKRRDQEAIARRAEQSAIRAAAQQQLQAQRASIAASRDVVKAQKETTAAIEEQKTSWIGFGRVILAAATAFAGFQGFRLLVREGLEFNKTIESATLGIAALITAQVEMRDKTGTVVAGVEKLRIAQVLAADQITKLRIASLQTVGSTQDLVIAFQQAAAVGFRYGLTLDQIRVISVRMAQAANNIGLPLNQLNEEIRSLLAGTINPRNTRIATVLNITNEQVKAAQKAGTLFDFVSKKLEAFAVAGEETARTFTGTMTNVRKALQTLAGEATLPLFDALRTSLHSALSGIFDTETARISENFSGIVETFQTVFQAIGNALADAIEGGIEKAQELSEWLHENGRAVDELLVSAKLLTGEFASMVGEVTQLSLALTASGTEAGVFSTILIGTGVVVSGIHEAFQLIFITLGTIGAIILTGLIAPMIGFLRLAAKVAGVFDDNIAFKLESLAGEMDDFLTGLAKGFVALGKDWKANGLAIEQFLNKVQKTGPAAEKAFAANEKLRDSLHSLESAELNATKALDTQLTAKTLTQQQYADKVRQLQIQTVQGQIKAQKAYFDTLDQADNRDRQHTLRTIQQLQRREDALKRGITLKSNDAPAGDDPKTLARQAKDLTQAQTIANKQELSEQLRDLKISLDAQKISYKQYYDGVTKAQQDFFRKQIAAQETLKAAITDPAKRKEIQAQIDALQSESLQKGEDNTAKRIEDEKKLAEEVTKAHVQLLKDEGKLSDARVLEIGDKYKKLIAQLKAEGDTEGANIVARLFQVDNAKTKLEELMNFAKTSSDRLTVELSAIQTEISSRTITEEQGRLKILDAYIRTRNELEKMLPLMQQAALITLGTSDDQEVENIRIKIEQLNLTIKQTSDGFFKLKEAGRQGLEEGITSFITDAISGTKNLSEAFQAAAQIIIQSLARVAAQMLSNLVIQRSLSFLGGFIGAGAGASLPTLPTISFPGLAAGGLIRGPGTATSDSIPARLSAGEFVVRAAAVREMGVEFFTDLNQQGAYTPRARRHRGFADGGLVERSVPGDQNSRNDKLTIAVRPSEAFIVGVLESPKGSQVQIDNLRRNRNAVERTLRR